MARTTLSLARASRTRPVAARKVKRWQSPWFWAALILTLALALRAATAVVNLRNNVDTVPFVAALYGLDFLAGPSIGNLDPAKPLPGIQARSLARLALLRVDATTAERWLRAAPVDSPADALTQFELCRLYWQQERRAEALAACRAGRVPAAYWLWLGAAALQNQNRDLAADCYDMATAVEPDNPEAWERLARVQMDRKAYAAAAVAYETAQARGMAATPGFYNGFGEAYVLLDRPADARVVFEQGVRAFPDSRVLINDLAGVYVQLGELELADAWYGRLLERWPDTANAWAARGQLALQNDDPAAAAFTYEQAVALAPDNVGYWLGLATAYETGGDAERAAAAYARVLGLDPDNSVALQQLDSPPHNPDCKDCDP